MLGSRGVRTMGPKKWMDKNRLNLLRVILKILAAVFCIGYSLIIVSVV
jgi:hypothetical protein